MVITAIVEASVAVGRLTSFLNAPELQEDAVLRGDPVEAGEESVRIRDATFTWNKDDDRNVLENLTFSAHKGELSCIVGRVGAGKSSFLSTMLGDLYKIRGEVVLRGSVAYVAQSPWVCVSHSNVCSSVLTNPGHECFSARKHCVRSPLGPCLL
jgi:ABC-type multidrug transport system fused ATPase/permease subunit